MTTRIDKYIYTGMNPNRTYNTLFNRLHGVSEGLDEKDDGCHFDLGGAAVVLFQEEESISVTVKRKSSFFPRRVSRILKGNGLERDFSSIDQAFLGSGASMGKYLDNQTQ